MILPSHTRLLLLAALLSVILWTASNAVAQEADEPASGDAPAEAAASDASIVGERSLFEIIRRGGYVMIPILVISVVGLAFTIERFIHLRRDVHIPDGLAARVLNAAQTGGPEAALKVSQEAPSSLGRLLAAALMRSGTSRQEMTQAVDDESGRLQYDLRRNTRAIGIVAGIEPLLGLLGTVLGMIRAFDKVAEGGLGRQTQLAGGISEALLTTFFGLSFAIVYFLLFHFFKGRGDDIVREVEELAVRFVLRLQENAPAAAESAAAADATGANEEGT